MVRIGKNSRHLRVFHIILHKKKKTKRSWTNYIRDCVKWIIKTHHIDISNKIENSGGDFSSYRQRDKTLVWSLLLHSYANRTAARTHAHTHVSRFTRIWEMIVFETRTKKNKQKCAVGKLLMPQPPPTPAIHIDWQREWLYGLAAYHIFYCLLLLTLAAIVLHR